MPEVVAPLFSLTGSTTPLAATLPRGRVSINSSKTVSSVKLPLTLKKLSAMPLWTDHEIFFVSLLSQSFFVLLDVVHNKIKMFDTSLLMTPFLIKLDSDAIPREVCMYSIDQFPLIFHLILLQEKSVRHSGWVWLGWSCDHMHINASHH